MTRHSSSSGIAKVVAAFSCCCLFVSAAAQYESCNGTAIADIGDGRCDAELNVPSCGYDGGDCCPCTCVDGPAHSCSDSVFDCLYPDCQEGSADNTEEVECLDDKYLSDSFCDLENNSPSCGYDGGDCCGCSCEPSLYPCGYSGFACEDPACFDPALVAEFPDCPGGWLSLGDGFCDAELNVPSCGYDGGDCCMCSCTGTACSFGTLDCLDPDAADPFFECTPPPPAAPPCLADAQRTWVVENSAQAHDVAAAVNCSGGSFEVEWRGSVVVRETIYVGGGTVLSVSAGDGAIAVADGNSTTRLFTVVNATLRVTGVNLSNGSSLVGGAIAAVGSTLSLDRTDFVGNSATAGSGGAVYVSDGSSVACAGGGAFSGNRAAQDGGALYATGGSTVSCGGLWTDNVAGDSGGAVGVYHLSSMSWSDEATFSRNSAFRYGGAMSIYNLSSVSWSGGRTSVSYNHAGYVGGGLVVGNSQVSWTGSANFTGNHAVTCGAVCAVAGSSITWSGPGSTRFIGQNVSALGGALYAYDANITWSEQETLFSGNHARNGGAVFLANGSTVGWTGSTEFALNEASADGGAVGSSISDPLYNPRDSSLVIDGPTLFRNNSAAANGGVLALVGGCSVTIGGPPVEVTFEGNSAGVAGGAVFLSSTGFGPVFTGVDFRFNTAQVGGAFSMFASGNSEYADDTRAATTFDRCRFTGNKAFATGGAIETAAGHDAVVASVFEGNSAGTGGALRLAGAASVYNCSFVENVSLDRQGAAVSNIGFVYEMGATAFSGNAFDCPEGTFLDFESGDPYKAVCDGCPAACKGCSFEERLLAPTCSAVLEHSNSSGGVVTMDKLSINPGYWRATESSTAILRCYNEDACLGGVTGSTGYCREGYEGPYCAICSKGYTAQIGRTCSKCSDSTGGIVVAAVLVVVALLAAVAVVSYVTSGERYAKGQGVVERVGRYIPLQSLKIVIVAWQILTQFTSVANITYPCFYQRFLDGLEVFNFDLGWILAAGCVVDMDFHDRLLVSTICPIAGLLFLAGVYAAASRLNRGRGVENLERVWHKHVSMVLLLTFLVYASVSSVLFKAFACEWLDDEKYYLRADYRIECDSPRHKAFMGYAGFMILLYTVGIPAFYGTLLFRDSDVLRRDMPDRERLARTTSTSDLWKPYKPSVFYYEVIECCRRILLAGVVVFIYPNTGAQISVTLLMAVVFAMLSEGLAPYASRWDTWINRMGHAVVTMSMYVALLLKVDVSSERADSQRIFEAVLVAAHACMLLVIVLEAAVQGVSLWVEKRGGGEEDDSNGSGSSGFFFRCRKVLRARRRGGGLMAEDDPFSADVYKVEKKKKLPPGPDRRQPRASSGRLTSSFSSSSRRGRREIAPTADDAEGDFFHRSVDTTQTSTVV